MSRLMQWVFFSVLALCSLAAGAVSASADNASGIIRFRGQIVEDPCVISTRQAMVNLSCYRDGKSVPYKYNALLPVTANNGLPEAIADTRVGWLNRERTMGVLTIIYR
ncbi:hypothetical protein JHU04_002169 [Brenneria sp. 4F2]|nr:hypothetical protein [Brenneria bubanii]